LLDVNALVAFGLREHKFHARVALWIKRLKTNGGAALATCAITEMGFLRASTHAPAYAYVMSQGEALLDQIKKSDGINLYIYLFRMIRGLPLYRRG
jgi:predicted nucleic acid-binding protein